MDRFRNFDAPRREQVTTIEFEMRTEVDDFAEAPDQSNCGFWPSRDPQAAGYVLPENFDAEHAKAVARMAAWQNGDWHYVGVFARATVSVAIGQGSFTTYELDSPGIWGIESDAGEYLAEVYKEQCDELLTHIASMGEAAKAAIAAAKKVAS